MNDERVFDYSCDPRPIVNALTASQRIFWDENGYLILPSFYSASDVDGIESVTDWVWRERPRAVIVDDALGAGRGRMSAFGATRAGNRLKLNDLYLLSQTVRAAALDGRLVGIMTDLLGDKPVLVNTLSIDVGTTQPMHADNLFMTPPTDDALVATWVALEDVGADQGPIFYYPGSHKIPPYRFSNGLQSFIEDEADAWNAYMKEAVAVRGLESQTFLPKRGDVLIWHARLLHGGSPILDAAKTRKSLVSHFFATRDCVYLEYPIVRLGDGGYWLNRSEQTAAAPSDRVVPAPPEDLSLPAERVAGCGTAVVDSIVTDGGWFVLRGWAVDERARQPLRALGVRLPDGRVLRADYGLGRHDVVAVYGEPAYNDCGFLLFIPGDALAAGDNVLSIVGVSADGITTYDEMTTTKVSG